MKNHRFPWLRNRTTDNRKCEKARNIKEKRTIEMFNMVSRALAVHRSSQRDNYLSMKLACLQGFDSVASLFFFACLCL